MSRTSLQEKRLRFFERGNTLCPICLTPFTEPDVRAGKVVTLEHAPQESVGGKPACLTCADCNTGESTGMIDRAVADYYRARDQGGYSVTIETDGKRPYTIHPKHLDIEKDEIRIRTQHDVIGESLGPFTLRWTEPKPDAIRIGLLKSAYLMVFCLLGKVGYRYAEGQAVSSIREQLLSPEKKLVQPLVLFTDDTLATSHLPEHVVFLLTEGRYWMVKIGTNFVILPPGGSIDRYRRFAEALQPSLTLGSTVRWPAIKFGDTIPIVGGKPAALKTENLFGKPARYRTHPHQEYGHGVTVYGDSDMVAVLRSSGPPASES